MPNSRRRLHVGGGGDEVARDVAAALGEEPVRARPAALAIVSCVVKVLLATMNSVVCRPQAAQHRRDVVAVDVGDEVQPMPRLAKASSAGTTICGPRSLPPMPMLTTSRDAAAWRRRARARRRPASRRAPRAPRRECGAGAARRAQRGVQHRAALGGVDRLRRRTSRRAALRMPHSRASSSSSLQRGQRPSRFFDRSAKTSGACRRQRIEAARVAREGLAQVEVAAVGLDSGRAAPPGRGAVAAK